MKNVPNILTVSRIVLVLVFVLMATLADPYYFGKSTSMMYLLRWIAYILVILAGLPSFV